jgi:hypothetical protein
MKRTTDNKFSMSTTKWSMNANLFVSIPGLLNFNWCKVWSIFWIPKNVRKVLIIFNVIHVMLLVKKRGLNVESIQFINSE